MAYETGTASGVVDLLNKFATFVESNGWTRDSLGDEGSGRRYHAHNGANYINFRAYANEAPGANFDSANSTGVYSVAFNIGTGYNGSNPWYDQAGVPVGSSSREGCAGMTLSSGAISAYHFFSHDAGQTIYCVVERSSGVYTYIGFGELIKHGSYTGGRFFFGGQSGVTTSTSSGAGFFGNISGGNGQAKGYVTVDVDAETGWHWAASGSFSGRDSARRYVRDQEADNVGTMLYQPNTHNGLSLVMPVIICVERDTSHATTSSVSSIGELPHCGSFIIGPSIVPSQQVSMGSDDYRVFPFFAKSNSDYALEATTHSGFRGWAIKE